MRRGQPDRAVPGERNDGLDRSLAERARAHDDGAAMVLQRAGDDLGRRGRPAVDQDDDGKPVGDVARLGVEALGLVGPARPRRDHLAAIEEGVRHLDRLIEQPARVVAEIENQALDVVADLVLHFLHGALDAGRSLLAERGDANIADVALGARAHRLDLDHRARDGHVERLAPGAPDGEDEVGVDRPPHALDRLGEAEALDRLAVEVGDQVARLEPGAIGRRVVDRRDHLDQAAFHGDLDAEPAELAPGLHLHVAEALGVEVARMGIERGQHAVDRRFDQRLVAHVLDVVRAHALEHVAEQIELAIGFRRVGLRPGVKGDDG